MDPSQAIAVCAMYHFVEILDCESLQKHILDYLRLNNIRGTLLIAREGINGTVAGRENDIENFKAWLRTDDRFLQITTKDSIADKQPFHRTKVKIKQEIVTMGVLDIDPREIVGTYVKATDWNALISDPDVTLIDTRNEYEIAIGTFKGATNPHTSTFREFPTYADQQLDPAKHKKIAMFCTGGIRCEKSTAFLKAKGFSEVYHLDGGILKYLEEVPESETMWQGECFVFDDRVTVDHQLQPGSYDQCHACRMPITEADKLKPSYSPGVSCCHCISKKTDADRVRFKEREKQIQLSQQRGESHIGSDAQFAQSARSEAKKRNRKSKVDSNDQT